MRKRDYSDIKDQVIEKYLKLRSVNQVAAIFSISTATVSLLVRTAGYSLMPRGGHVTKKSLQNLKLRCAAPSKKSGKPAGYVATKPLDGSCAKCNSYSPSSLLDGWCMKHRRAAKPWDILACYN